MAEMDHDNTADTHTLASGSLGILESAVMGVAGTAPAFSIAVTTALIVAAVGPLAVGSIFYCGLIMFGIMLAFAHLNKITANAGATYAWVGMVFGRTWGFFAGWGLLTASIVFMVSATIPAATSTLVLLAPQYVENTHAVTFVAALWLTLVSLVVTRGIKHASYAQVALTVIETVIILVLVVTAVVRFAHLPAHVPSLNWFSLLAFSPDTFAKGALTAIFFYWGWDVTMNLGEETKVGEPDPAAMGAFWAMLNLIVVFIVMMIVVLMVLSDEEIASANTNVLYAIANKLFVKPWTYLAVLSTVLSTVGTIETQILQFSRTMFAMARDKAFHKRYAAIHPEWKTPYLATFVIWSLGLVLLYSSSYMNSVKEILDSSVSALAFQICFYLSLAGFACAWHYREKLKQGAFAAVSYVLWPAFSASFMVFIALYSIHTFSKPTLAVGIGGLLLGFIPLKFARR